LNNNEKALLNFLSKTFYSTPAQPPKDDKQKVFEFKFKIGGGGAGGSQGPGGSGGAGGSSQNPFGDEKTVIGFIAGISILAALTYYNNKYKEITWREFLANYLLQDKVERLEVVNKKWVRVVMNKANESMPVPWFSIGSVDSFERNLESVQSEHGVESTNFVPVLYKDEMDSSTYWTFASYILPILFIWFLIRRAGAGMGMGGMPGARPGGKGGILGFGQSTARILKENTGVTFKYAFHVFLNFVGSLLLIALCFLKRCCRL